MGNNREDGVVSRVRHGRPPKLGVCEVEFLRTALIDNPTIYLDELEEELYATFGACVSLATLCRPLFHTLIRSLWRHTSVDICRYFAQEDH